MNNIKVLPWHQPNWQYLTLRHQSRNLPHALLLSGSLGLGKLIFATHLAQLLLCKNENSLNQPQPSACNCCKSCVLFKANNHPDVLLIQPQNAAHSIKIEQIRSMITDVSHTAHQGGLQIVIIDQADMMNSAAANALLKTLEDPSGSTIIILISAHCASLPATVLSRCQKVVFKTPSTAVCHEWLQQQLQNNNNTTNVTDEEIDIALQLTHNAPILARHLLENKQLPLRKKFLQEFFTYLLQVRSKSSTDESRARAPVATSAIKLAENYAHTDINFLLELFLSVIADLVKQKSILPSASPHHSTTATIPSNFMLNQDFIPDLKNLSSLISLEQLFSYYQELLTAKKVLATNIALNKQLLLENLLLTFNVPHFA